MKKFLLAAAIMTSLCATAFAAGPLKSNCTSRSMMRADLRNETVSNTVKIKKSDKHSTKTLSAISRADDANTPITVAPEGTVKTYQRSGLGIYEEGFYPAVGSDYGLITEVVWCDNGDVYIKNPLMFYNTDAYMKGHVEGNEIVVDLPQALERSTDDPDDPDAYVIELNITLLKGEVDEYGDLEFIPEEGPCQLRYTIEGDSFGRELDEDEFSMLGLVWDDYFMDYGELSCQYEPFSATPIEVPSGLKTEEWGCTYGGDGHYVGIAFDGKDVYIKGIAPSLPDTWIKGSVSGDKVTFASEQYLGVDSKNHHMAYFFGATMSLEEDPEWGDMVMTPHFADGITFTYDAEEQIMSSEDAILINASTTQPYYLNLLDKPVIRVAPKNSANIPNNPVILNFILASFYGVGAVQFDLPRTSTDGAILDTENMYYNVYYGDKVTELIEDMPNIPWNYSDGWDFSVYGITHEAYYYDSDVEVIGIQNCYDNNDTVTKSAIVYTDGTVVKDLSGVEDAAVAKTAKTTEFTDLLGRKVTNPSGIVIRKTTYSDGTVNVDKVICR